ncbi:MAG TPA: GlsB/YeaQ/YmgE family stress response membrane protein [Candidatus Dormibacteraeota bacterium]|nr:GlsB/YeaQ/YmgE family stress response membrane protein [Candidatus Dormibacteraeota bacterium]
MLDFIGFVVVGGGAGWVAGRILTGDGYGPLIDVMLGIAGGIVGGWIVGIILGTLGQTRPGGLLAEFFISLIGACILVAIVHLIRRQPMHTSRRGGSQ